MSWAPDWTLGTSVTALHCALLCCDMVSPNVQFKIVGAWRQRAVCVRTAFNVFGVSEHFSCSSSCVCRLLCSAGECVMHGVQIGRLTGSERNLVALCAFGQVIPTTSRLRRGRKGEGTRHTWCQKLQKLPHLQSISRALFSQPLRIEAICVACKWILHYLPKVWRLFCHAFEKCACAINQQYKQIQIYTDTENVSCYHAQSPTPPCQSSSQSSFDRRGSQWHHECFMQNGGGAGTSCRQFLIIMIFVIINISIGIIIVVITSSSSSSSSSWDIVIIIVIAIVILSFRCNHHHQPTCHYHLNNCKLSYFLVSCCDCHNDFN